MDMNDNDWLPLPPPPPIPPVPTIQTGPPLEPCQCGELLAVDALFRDEAACFALMGLLAWSPAETDNQFKPSEAASLAYRYADAMLEARNLPPGAKP